MPMPKPHNNETHEDFLARCMGNDVMNSEYSDRDQRFAVCNSLWGGKANMDIERKGIVVELKDAKVGTFVARIATLGVRDKDNDITRPGAFTEGKTVLVSAYMHGSWMGKLPVGKATIHEQGNDVIAEGQFNLNTTEGRDTYEAIKFAPELQEWSYGFYPTESEPGKDEDEGARILKKVDVREISPVLVGAGVNTGVLAIKSGEETKPYENEHACRLREPDDFQDDTFRRTTRSHEGKKYAVIMGRLKGEDTMTEQAYRYNKDAWSESEAKSHCKDHDGSFEAAKKKLTEGMAYAEQAEAVLAAVKDLADRTKSLADLRLKEGRALSAENRLRMQKLLDSLDKVAAELKTLLKATEPRDERALAQAKLMYMKVKYELSEVI